MSSRDDCLRAFGSRVRARREGLGVSQEELASACGLHRTYVGSVERGERNPTLLSMTRLAGALRTTVRDLVDVPQTETKSNEQG